MVYLLEPKRYKWIQGPSVSQELSRKQVQGIALQQSDLPSESVLKAKFALPDICSPAEGFRLVSDRGRAVLQEVAPGCVAFFPLNLRAPAHMLTSKAYFFIDVLPRAQLIDWDLSPTVPRVVFASDGRESRALKCPPQNLSIKFKPVRPETPRMWREADVDCKTVHFFPSKGDVFMRDELWEDLDAKLPGQLVARKVA